jgi:5-methylcytosine-specific restriction endonuclease McrA
MKRSRLARKTRLKAISEKEAERRAELEAVRPLIMARSRGICEVCDEAPVDHLHHKLRRSQGGKNDLANLIGVCFHCQSRIHSHPTISYETGLLKRSSS